MSRCISLSLAIVSFLAIRSSAQNLTLPDPLLCTDGTKVTTSQLWESKRRSETLDLFHKEVYGYPSVGKPTNMRFQLVEQNNNAMGGTAILKRVNVWYANDARTDSLAINLVLFIPKTNKKPYPTFLMINHRSESNTDPSRQTKSDFWPAEAVIARGYAISAFHVSGVDPDVRNRFTDGVHRVFDGGKRLGSESWGMLSAWAWGASRIMDYFATDGDIDQNRVAVVGHSRSGKAALVAGAVDKRFFMPISNNSGHAGAALARRMVGEDVRKIVSIFPDWFCSNYAKYIDREDYLPIDQHQLIALQAPRPVYVTSSSEDVNADPEGEFLSLVHGLPVYKLYGKNGLGTTTWPAVNTPVHGDAMAYHVKSGGHGMNRYDWDRFMDYFDKVNGASDPISYKIPGTLEAEDYSAMSGVKSEATTDEGGGQNLGYINNGDWSEYSVEIEGAATYRAGFRVASQKGGTIRVLVDGADKGSVEVHNTGGWQEWTTVATDISLPQGSHTIRLAFVGDGDGLLNINWMSFALQSTSTPDRRMRASGDHPATVPRAKGFKVELPRSHTFSSYEILGPNGRVVRKGTIRSVNALTIDGIGRGLWVVRLQSPTHSQALPVVVER